MLVRLVTASKLKVLSSCLGLAVNDSHHSKDESHLFTSFSWTGALFFLYSRPGQMLDLFYFYLFLYSGPGQVPDPSDCTAFFTCLAATTDEGGRRSAGKK